jgi:hypothetical protein
MQAPPANSRRKIPGVGRFSEDLELPTKILSRLPDAEGGK